MSTPPKAADERIETVLLGLNSVASPPGLEARILLRLRQAPSPAVQTFAGRLWIYSGGLAAALLLALSFVVATRSAHPPARLSATSALQVLPNVPPALTPPSPGQPPRIRTHRSYQTAAPPEAVSEPRSTSFPAPPPPLTDQERLLLRLAHRPSPGTLAIFNPDLRQERAALEAAEFNQFFQPPPPANQPDLPKEDKNAPSDSATN